MDDVRFWSPATPPAVQALPVNVMRLAAICLVGLLSLASTTSCGSVTAPACDAACNGDLTVFGRASVTWSNSAVPGATVTVRLYADTTRTLYDCSGTTPLAVATQPIDTTGNYRVPIVVPDAASRWVCVEVTADPHGWASDVGLNHVSGGVIQLRATPDGAKPDSLRVDIHYSELS